MLRNELLVPPWQSPQPCVLTMPGKGPLLVHGYLLNSYFKR